MVTFSVATRCMSYYRLCTDTLCPVWNVTPSGLNVGLPSNANGQQEPKASAVGGSPTTSEHVPADRETNPSTRATPDLAVDELTAQAGPAADALPCICVRTACHPALRGMSQSCGWECDPALCELPVQSAGERTAAPQEEEGAGVANDAAAAAAEADLAQHAGDVGDWLGVDSGAPQQQRQASAQVALAADAPRASPLCSSPALQSPLNSYGRLVAVFSAAGWCDVVDAHEAGQLLSANEALLPFPLWMQLSAAQCHARVLVVLRALKARCAGFGRRARRRSGSGSSTSACRSWRCLACPSVCFTSAPLRFPCTSLSVCMDFSDVSQSVI
jgi:hypothetical protein